MMPCSRTAYIYFAAAFTGHAAWHDALTMHRHGVSLSDGFAQTDQRKEDGRNYLERKVVVEFA